MAAGVCSRAPQSPIDPTLDVLHVPAFLDAVRQKQLWDDIIEQVPWHRVKYCSNRFGSECETPCWTNCYGGFAAMSPYQEFPPILQALKQELEIYLKAKFNIVLMRLYLTGDDNIAWHTDGREFLGKETVVASISLGEPRRFEMKKVEVLWPEVHKPEPGASIATNKPVAKSLSAPAAPKLPEAKKEELLNWTLKGGDLFVMRGVTQQFWHHRVPQERAKRRPQCARLNINFRYVLPNDPALALRGHSTYYRYTVTGDTPYDKLQPKMYRDLIREWEEHEAEANKPKKNKFITEFFCKNKTG
jgi:alkylated DNA repair dioxygenase AlkB